MKNHAKLLFTLACIQFTHVVDFVIMMPLGPQLMRIFNISPEQFSIVVSSYTFSAGTSGLISAFFIDKFDRKKALIFCYTGFIIGTFACSFANDYHLLIAARVLTGFFGGVLGALLLSIISDVIPFENRASAMGVVMASFSVASVLGVPTGLYLASLHNWQFPFFVLGCVSILVFGLIFLFIPSLTAHITAKKGNTLETILGFFKERNTAISLLFMLFVMIGQFSVIPFISPYLVSNVGFPEKNLFLIYLVGGLVTIVSSPILGKLADKYGKPKVFAISAALSTIPVYLITNLEPIQTPILLCITAFFFILMGGRMIPASAIASSAALPQVRGSFMSINSSVQQFGSGISAYIAGQIIFKTPSGQLENYPIVGYLAIIASIVAIYLCFKVEKKG